MITLATESGCFGGQVGSLAGLATEKGVFGGQVSILITLATEKGVFGGQAAGKSVKDGVGGGVTFTDERRNAGFHDAGLFKGNLLQRVAKQRAVVQADGRNNGKLRHQKVGGIKPAAKAGFYNGDVHMLIGKPAEGHAGGDFKETQVLRLKVRFPLLKERLNVLPRNHFPVNTCPLPEIHQVRRRVKASLVPCSSERRGQHVGHGALAIGPRHMNGPELPRRTTQHLIEPNHPLQPRLVRPGLEPLLLHRRESLEDILNQLLVFHTTNIRKT